MRGPKKKAAVVVRVGEGVGIRMGTPPAKMMRTPLSRLLGWEPAAKRRRRRRGLGLPSPKPSVRAPGDEPARVAAGVPV